MEAEGDGDEGEGAERYLTDERPAKSESVARNELIRIDLDRKMGKGRHGAGGGRCMEAKARLRTIAIR